jgi:O-antigen/teichoic acid export membrane protein
MPAVPVVDRPHRPAAPPASAPNSWFDAAPAAKPTAPPPNDWAVGVPVMGVPAVDAPVVRGSTDVTPDVAPSAAQTARFIAPVISRRPATRAAGAGAEIRRSARSGMIGLAGAAVNGLFGFVLTAVIVRGFGPVGSGAMFAAIGVVSIVGAVCCLGADTGMVWALPRRRSGPAGDAARLLPVALVPPLVIGSLVAVVGILLADTFAPVFLDQAGADGPRLIQLAFIAVPATVALTVLMAAVRALRPIGAYVSVQYLLVPISRPLLVIAALVTGGGLVLGFAGWLAPVAVGAVVAALLLVGPIGLGHGVRLRPLREDWRVFWGFALPRAVSVAIDASSMWVGVLLTAALAGQAAAGVFGAVGRYAMAGLLVMQGLRIAVAPQLSRLLGEKRNGDAALVYGRTTIWIIVLSWPAYLLLAVFAPGFLLLFGDGFEGGATPMAILAVAMMVNAGVGLVQTLLLMSGKSGRHLFATVSGLTVNVVLGFLLIPDRGALGAAIAWSAGIVVENVIAAVAARSAVGRPLFTRAVWLTGAVSLGVSAVLAAAGVALAGRGVAGLAVTLGLMAVTCLGLLASGKVRGAVRDAVSTLKGERAT